VLNKVVIWQASLLQLKMLSSKALQLEVTGLVTGLEESWKMAN